MLEAVIQSYVETAEPAGSRNISRRFGLGVSPATIRNTMSDLEEKGYLFHPHTSAGRIPTDKAYRVYVDNLLQVPNLTTQDRDRLHEELHREGRSAIETILRRAAQSLGVLTQDEEDRARDLAGIVLRLVLGGVPVRAVPVNGPLDSRDWH